MTQGAKLSFDASLQQIMLALTTGASLIALPDEVRVDRDLLLGWLDQQQITHLDSVPSLWSPLVRAVRARPAGSVVLPALRTVLLAGEAPRADEVN